MYKRIFFSKATAVIALLLVFAFAVIGGIIGNRIGEIGRFDLFDIVVRLLLAVFLFYGHTRHNILAMQAGVCGLLVCMVYYQANYVLETLLSRNVESFIILGFWGSFYLAGELMLLILEVILTVNHFVIFVLEKQSFLRVSVSQVTILILFAFLLFQLFIVSQLQMAPMEVAFCAVNNLGIVATCVLVACAELILALDWKEGGI